MCLLSSVACLYRSLRNEDIWFLYLNLKVVSQMYVSFVVKNHEGNIHRAKIVASAKRVSRRGCPGVQSFH